MPNLESLQYDGNPYQSQMTEASLIDIEDDKKNYSGGLVSTEDVATSVGVAFHDMFIQLIKDYLTNF